MAGVQCTCVNHNICDTSTQIMNDIRACKATDDEHDCVCRAPNSVLFNCISGQFKLRTFRESCRALCHECTCQGEFDYLRLINSGCRADGHDCTCEEARTCDDCRAEEHVCICAHDDEPDCDCGACNCFDRRMAESEATDNTSDSDSMYSDPEDSESGGSESTDSEPVSKRVRAK